jgi:nucleotide sugar dehydrogenase
MKTVTVVGLGKIGLPLAAQYASRGMKVIGADIDAGVVAVVNQGLSPHLGEPGLAELVANGHAEKLLSATTDTVSAVKVSSVVVVVVPLVVDDKHVPDFRALDAVTKAISEGLQPGTLVCYETTLPVGTTRHRFAPVLERAGLRCGEDFFMCFSPERVYTGRTFADLRKYPKLVGGLDPASTAAGVVFYESALEFDDRPDLRPDLNGVWPMANAEAAELAKLAETTYRDVNIALANEFALFSETVGIDVYEVVKAANTQPYSHIHQPGVAVGGHCIPVYPRLYMQTHPDAQMPAASRSVNEAMPAHAVDLLSSCLGPLHGKRIVILGIAYRGGVKEVAFSGALSLHRVLRAAGAHSAAHDPLFTDAEIRGLGFEPYHLGDPADGAILQADHKEYHKLDRNALGGASHVVDGRNMGLDRLIQSGVNVVTIGRARPGAAARPAIGRLQTTKSPSIHPTAFVEAGAVVGHNTFVWHHSQVRDGAIVGDRCVLGKNVFVDTRAVVGNDVKIQNNVSVYQGVVLEDAVFVGPSAVFTNDLYPRAASTSWDVVATVVRRGASIGANATIICGNEVGAHATVAAGSVVTRPVPDHALVVGNPARVVGWMCVCGAVASRAAECPKDTRCTKCVEGAAASEVAL